MFSSYNIISQIIVAIIQWTIEGSMNMTNMKMIVMRIEDHDGAVAEDRRPKGPLKGTKGQGNIESELKGHGNIRLTHEHWECSRN